MLLCLGSFDEFVVQVVQDTLSFQERVVVLNDELDFSALLATVTSLLLEHVQAALKLVDAGLGMHRAQVGLRVEVVRLDVDLV